MKRLSVICFTIFSLTAYGQSGFTPDQEKMIMAADENTPMRVYQITNPEDSLLLRTKSDDITVDPDDPVLQHFIKRLYATVTDSASLGAGIAAPQVGILKNIIWVQRFDKPKFPFEVYLNPRIIQYSEQKYPCREGCLSVPNRSDSLSSRSYTVLVEYDRPDGSHNMEMVEEFTSVIWQHEVDHLNGIIYLDHLKKEQLEARKDEADSTTISESTKHDALAEEEKIRTVRGRSNTALAKQDVAGILNTYASNITITGGAGTQLDGRETLEQFLTDLFAANPGLYYIRSISDIEVSADGQRAWETGRWREVPGKAGGKYSAHWVIENGVWKIRSQVFVGLR